MNYSKVLGATCLLVGLLVACAQSSESAGAPPAKNFVKFTFNGQTKTFTDASLQQAGNTLGEITAASSDTEGLSITFFGAAPGSYPYKQKMSEYRGVSQIEYKTNDQVFTNYKARVCATSSGYYSTLGEVKITEYVAGKVVKGTFTGALLDQNDPDPCSIKDVSFSGEFSIAQ